MKLTNLLQGCFFVLTFSVCLIQVPSVLAEHKDVVLVKDGKAQAVIVVADQPLTLLDHAGRPRLTQRDAAERLSSLIERATGVSLPIVAASEAPDQGTRVYVGHGPHLDHQDIEVPSASEGLQIAVANGNLFLLGEIAAPGTNNWEEAVDRGTMHAVETFLEEVVDYRFIISSMRDEQMFELGTVTPQLDTLVVAATTDIRDAPAFDYRVAHGTPGGVVMGLRQGQSLAFRANHVHHGWDRLYAKEHPELFVLKENGQRDFRFIDYAEPLVLEKDIKHLETYFETGRPVGMQRKPTRRYILAEPEDNYPDSHSEAAQRWLDYDRHRWGRQSDLWFDYVRRLAGEVEQRWPDMRVSTLAYQWHTLPPSFDIPDNVDVMLCLMAPTTVAKEPEVFEANKKMLRDWSARVGNERERLLMWDYWCWPGFWTCAPTMNPYTQQRWLQFAQPYASGTFINGGGHPDPYDHIMYRLLMRLLWNPQLDIDAELTDICRAFYGPAGETMLAFYRRLIDRYESVEWPQNIVEGYAPPTLFYGQTFPPDEIDARARLLEQAKQQVGLPVIIETDAVPGTAWRLMNVNNTDIPLKMTLTALDGTIDHPKFVWAKDSLAYQGSLHPGQRLTIKSDGSAVLSSVELTSPELVPEKYALSKEKPAVSSKRYLVHRVPLKLPVQPGDRFQVTVGGLAVDGGQSLAAFTENGKRQRVFMPNRFKSKNTTIEQIVTIPNGMTKLNYLDLYRGRHAGTVTYNYVSLQRVREQADEQLQPVDVNNKIEGTPPILPADGSQIIHFQASHGSKIPQLQVVFEDDSLSNQLEKPDDIYVRRVAWTAEPFQVFQPTQSMYEDNTGFFVASEIAFSHIDQPILRQVGDPANAQPISLVRGRPNAKVPFDNLGFPADVQTRVMFFIENGKMVMQVNAQGKPQSEETITISMRTPDNPAMIEYVLPVNVKNDNNLWDTWSITESGWSGRVVFDRLTANGKWPAILLVQVQRERGQNSYVLSPRLGPPWGEFAPNRFARLQLANQPIAEQHLEIKDDRAEPTEEYLPF